MFLFSFSNNPYRWNFCFDLKYKQEVNKYGTLFDFMMPEPLVAAEQVHIYFHWCNSRYLWEPRGFLKILAQNHFKE